MNSSRRGAAQNKYSAIKTTVGGVTFASRAEARRYQELQLLERGKEISALELQPSYPIEINGQKVCKVILDFRYTDTRTGCVVVEDVKGMDNPLSRLKRKLVEASWGIDVKLI